MKKIVSTLALVSMLIASPALAHGHERFGHHGGGWFGPLLGGVVLGAIINDATRPRAVVRPAPTQTLVCENIQIRDKQGNYILDEYGHPMFAQNCWYQQSY